MGLRGSAQHWFQTWPAIIPHIQHFQKQADAKQMLFGKRKDLLEEDSSELPAHHQPQNHSSHPAFYQWSVGYQWICDFSSSKSNRHVCQLKPLKIILVNQPTRASTETIHLLLQWHHVWIVINPKHPDLNTPLVIVKGEQMRGGGGVYGENISVHTVSSVTCLKLKLIYKQYWSLSEWLNA